MALSEDVTKLNSLVFDVWLIRLLGKGKDQLFDEHFDYLFEVANHGVFHTTKSRLLS